MCAVAQTRSASISSVYIYMCYIQSAVVSLFDITRDDQAQRKFIMNQNGCCAGLRDTIFFHVPWPSFSPVDDMKSGWRNTRRRRKQA